MTEYRKNLNNLLRPKQERAPLVLDLFAGCGGLALGFEAQGFETLGFEMEEDYCATYRKNLSGDCILAKISPSYKFPKAQVIIGGPPCQPFSVGGYQNGRHDSRDGFPTFIEAVRQAQPDIFLIENVRGMLYKNKDYLHMIMNKLRTLGYIVQAEMLNSVDFGVPQSRERVIIVGHKGIFDYPQKIKTKVTSGDALGELSSQIHPESKFLTPSQDEYVARYEAASKCINPRDLHLDKPSRTLTCRNLAGATGDMMRVRLPDGRRRRLLLREAAILQSFPDWFEFEGGETCQFTQVGNAVSPLLAYHLAGSVRAYLHSRKRLSQDEVSCINSQLSLNRKVIQLTLMSSPLVKTAANSSKLPLPKANSKT